MEDASKRKRVLSDGTAMPTAKRLALDDKYSVERDRGHIKEIYMAYAALNKSLKNGTHDSSAHYKKLIQSTQGMPLAEVVL